jgi:MFS family permease
LADRFGRTIVASGAMVLSGLCALVAGFAVAEPALLTTIGLVWGIAVVADSAQFSSAISELADPRYVGTALTMQTCSGFLLTMVTIRLMSPMQEAVGWGPAFAVLALGPVFGIASMMRLRRMPEAVRMASGRR